MCADAGHGDPEMSVLGVYNSTAFGSVLNREHNNFNKLFNRKAMLHHYTEFCDVDAIAYAGSNVQACIANYEDIEAGCNSHTREMTSKYTEKLFPAFA